ncbi:restriction endonuclease fold toxin 5 domain-containing protein [Streptomyces sp. NBC_01218]|uniref:Tox-REase-5 domain-containing protein n=1 Tax=Streptomyces sp. NBC_01218 TaxID=2903780 RepID=UPI002E158222|nr:restriction endonuclease fold toxin 5 domain-containing protein [Streptomyces sp. NBC_01218]
MPRALALTQVLLLVLVAATAVGAVGLFGSAFAVDAVGGELLGIVAWAALPGAAAWWLSRRLHEGGNGFRWAVTALQIWLVAGGASNLAGGSAHGLTQLLVPALILILVSRRRSREWFRLPPGRRAARPEFSVPHLITWRRDRGQTALEYLGLVLIVVALVGALTVGGLGGRITEGLHSAICSLTGSSCPVSGSGSVEAGSGTSGGTGGSAGTDGGTGSPGGSTTTTGGAGSDGGSTTTGGGAEGGSSGGAASGGTSGSTAGPTGGTDTYPGTTEEPEAAYDPPVRAVDSSGSDDEGGDGGDGDDEKQDCGGWGIFGCAWDQTTQVVKGVAVDGFWGDVTGIVDLFKPDTWSGLADYGKQLGNQWTQDSKDAAGKWSDGDYLGAVFDWGKASVGSVVSVGDTVFVGDEVRDRWNNGEKTRAVTDVIWNVGSLFIPGYDVAKVVGKVGKLGKLGKIAEEVADAAGDAGAAARRAAAAAEAGDLEGLSKAAKEADEAADKAEDAARRSGCVIASGPLVPTGSGGGSGGSGGVPGPGTGILAAGSAGRIVLAEGGCDPEAKAAAEKARADAQAAALEKKRLEEPERARKAAEELKQYPEPRRNDTSDPRNYEPAPWAKDLNDPELGSADLGDGYWASRDRNPPPNWTNESWLRYQEQVTGTVRGREYVVPNPKEGKPAVEYDGWDSSRQTFLEAKNGYTSYLAQPGRAALTASGKEKFLAEARAQVEASGGRAVEWHFSDPDVAKAARAAFREEGLPIKVVHTAQKPIDSARKPGAFD